MLFICCVSAREPSLRRHTIIIVWPGVSCNARPESERPCQPDDSPSGRYWLLPCNTLAMIGDSADTVMCTLASLLDPAIG